MSKDNTKHAAAGTAADPAAGYSIRRINNQGLEYGRPIAGDELREDLRAKVAAAARQHPAGGEVTLNNQRYRFTRAAHKDETSTKSKK